MSHPNGRDEMSALLAELRSQRRHVLGAFDQMSEDQLWTPVAPTSWPPIAVVHHLALDVERWWFRAILAGDGAARTYFDEHPGGAWTVPPETEVFALYESECALADAVLESTAPSEPAEWWPGYLGRRQTLREIMLHVISETATHAGHLDIVREAIDGRAWLVVD